jgi:hypothetical protein
VLNFLSLSCTVGLYIIGSTSMDSINCGLKILEKNFHYSKHVKTFFSATHWWITPVLLATKEAGIRRFVVQSQSGKIVLETSSKNINTKQRYWRDTSGSVHA